MKFKKVENPPQYPTYQLNHAGSGTHSRPTSAKGLGATGGRVGVRLPGHLDDAHDRGLLAAGVVPRQGGLSNAWVSQKGRGPDRPW